MVFGKKASGANPRFQSFDLLSTLIAVVNSNGSALRGLWLSDRKLS